MNKKLETLFNLPEVEDESVIDVDSIDIGIEDVKQELMAAPDMLNAITSMEKIDMALTPVAGIDTHDTDMDDVAVKAIESYQKLMDLGLQVSDGHAAKIFEAAAAMLKTAMDAKDAKVTRKLKTIELQLKKAKMDGDLAKGKRPTVAGSPGDPYDRNELMRIIKDTKG